MATYREHPEFRRKLVARITRNVDRAAAMVELEAERSMRGPVRVAGVYVPSLPPLPPHIRTGALKASIARESLREGSDIIGRIGSNAPHARRLELGYVGTDSAGRVIHQEARPYLRPALERNRREIARIVRTGR